MKYFLLLIFVFISFFGYSQKKVLQTKFTSDNITIDGKLNESIWETTPEATDFIMFQPDNGKPIPENRKTIVKVLYDNDAIYIGALLYDDEPEKIRKEITQRDNFGASDVFGVFINGFNDGQQDFQFYVNAADGQGDCITTDTNGEDYSWDAIWKSKAVITDFGWVVEMRIPYAALRFSGEKKQTWGLNFFRDIKRDRHKYSWNFIDSKMQTFTQQTGVLEGIENIKPPTRLFLLPYSSFYLNANKYQKTAGTLKGGLDIKYGINDAFTLDAILIPDFGQAKFDNQILNSGVIKNVKFDIEGNNNSIVIGKNTRITNALFFIRGNNHLVHIGEECFYGGGEIWIEDNNCSLIIHDCTTVERAHLAVTEPFSKIEIHKDCMLSNFVEIRTGDSHSILDIATGKRINKAKDVIIEEHVWIGAHAKILKGVTIKKNSVVGTASVVTGDIPENSIASGIPARVIRDGINWDRTRLYD